MSNPLSVLDEEMLRLAADNKSAREIGDKLNLPAESVALRVRELIGDRDAWGERVKFSLLLDNLYQLKDYLWSDVKTSGDPRSVANLIRTLEQLGKTLDKVSAINTEVDTKITETQAAFMLNLVVRAFEHAEKSVDQDLPWSEIQSAFREGLDQASQ